MNLPLPQVCIPFCFHTASQDRQVGSARQLFSMGCSQPDVMQSTYIKVIANHPQSLGA